jgi:hypothetical protein
MQWNFKVFENFEFGELQYTHIKIYGHIPEVGQRMIMKCIDLDENFSKYAIKRFKNEFVVRLSKKN